MSYVPTVTTTFNPTYNPSALESFSLAGQVSRSGIGTSNFSLSNVGTSSFNTGYSGQSYSTPSLGSLSVPTINLDTSLNVGAGFNSFAPNREQEFASYLRAYENQQLVASHNQMVNAELSGIGQCHQSVASTRKFDQLTAPVANFVADFIPYVGAAKSFYENGSVIFDSEASYGSKAFAAGNIAFDAFGSNIVKKAGSFLGAAGGAAGASARRLLGFTDEAVEAAVRNAPVSKVDDALTNRLRIQNKAQQGRTLDTSAKFPESPGQSRHIF